MARFDYSHKQPASKYSHITKELLESEIASGKTVDQIALDNNIIRGSMNGLLSKHGLSGHKKGHRIKNEFEVLFQKIETVQGNEWNGLCNRIDCYWNMWHPYKNPVDLQCVSESLSDYKMMPNTRDCPSYLSYEVFCGINKGELYQ